MDNNVNNNKHVAFHLHKNKTKILYVHNYAMRRSRDGSKWLTLSIDRIRFSNRIKSLENILNNVFNPSHRLKVYNERLEKL